MKPEQWVEKLRRYIQNAGYNPDDVIYNVAISGNVVIIQFASKELAARAVELAREYDVAVKSLGFQTVEFTLPQRPPRGKKSIRRRESGEVSSLPSGEIE